MGGNADLEYVTGYAFAFVHLIVSLGSLYFDLECYTWEA